MSAKTQELFENTAQKLIDMIEQGIATGNWEKPWKATFAHTGLPTNYTTKKAYNGFNVIALWLSASSQGFETNLWATYKQWKAVGGQVRKGESGTKGVKWGVTYTCITEGKKTGPKACQKTGHESSKYVWSSTFTLFNIAQVDGVELPETDDSPEAKAERLENVEEFVRLTGANVTHRAGDQAFFIPGTNDITLPLVEQFETTEGYYGTLLHELTHWSGSDGRLERDQKNPFGSQKYAAEELVAEMGSAMLAAHFGIQAEPHMNHAEYLAGWVQALKADPMNLYRAAKQASQASEWLLETTEARKVSEEMDEALVAA